MKFVAYYAMYRGMDPRLSRFVRLQARKNGFIAIAIDIQIFPPMKYSTLTIRVATSRLTECCRSFVWYLEETLRGHIIIPVPTIVWLIYMTHKIFKVACIGELPADTAAGLYKMGWPNDALAPELMGTYLRFIALQEEQYGLGRYDSRYVRLVNYTFIYSTTIAWIFKAAPPVAFISIYSGYIQHFVPCQHASMSKSPVLVLGCTDCLYRVSDVTVPRQFVHLRKNIEDQHESSKKLIALGNSLLNKRVDGQVDQAISYMRYSPFIKADTSDFWRYKNISRHLYECKNDNISNGSGITVGQNFVVVFMHELQDWHHNGVLPPFASSYYEWLFITVSYLIKEQTPFAIKVHPAIISEPRRFYETIDALCYLSSVVGEPLPVSTLSSTLELIDMGMELGVTVRGTIGLELAFLQTKLICAGNPPYSGVLERRVELDLYRYFYRLSNYKDEPMVTVDEKDAACYYVGLQDTKINEPEVHLGNSMLNMSPNADFMEIKKLL